MAMYKCTICGGNLLFKPGETTCVCDSCGVRQTMPGSETGARHAAPDRKSPPRRAAAPRARTDRPSPEVGVRNAANPDQNARSPYRPFYPLVKIALFFLALAAGTVVAFSLHLRQAGSEGERLAQFPSFSLGSLFGGDYFRGIDSWFSDTFPYRDKMVEFNGKLDSLYGIRKQQVIDTHDNFEDDEILDAPVNTRPTMPSATATDPNGSTTQADGQTTETTAVTTQPAQPPQEAQTLGGIIVVGDTGYETYSFSQAAADMYVGAVNRAAAALQGKATVYDILAPLGIDIVLDDATRANVHSADQKKAMEYIYGSMYQDIRTVDTYSILRQHRDEYLYFRTDHHWTATAAYYAYAGWAAQKGVSVPALSDYETKEFSGYLGSLYNKTKNETSALSKNPDTVVAYLPPCGTTLTFTDTKGKQTNWRVIYDVSGWNSASKYNTFIGGDNPFTVIRNTDKQDGTSCVVIKESFGNAFVPFLIPHYETVYVIDYRYYNGELTDFVTQNGVQDVIFVNNMSATRSTNLMKYVDGLIK